MIHEALVPRLLEQYDPFLGLGFRRHFCRKLGAPVLPPTLAEVEALEPLEFIPVEERDHNYHGRRIAYFVHRLRSGEPVDPIEVDNECFGMHIYPQIVVLDGHHRFAAAVLLEVSTLLVGYSGRIDLLDWLTGVRDTCPGE